MASALPNDELFDEAEFGEEVDEQLDTGEGTGRKRLFSKELRCMMYGFGDDRNPFTESVDLLEDLVIEFITEITHKASEVGKSGKVQTEDIIFLVRKVINLKMLINHLNYLLLIILRT
jgi:transcription initiation factor TFIID subunit 13